MGAKILYPITDGEVTGGNIISLKIIKETLKRGYDVLVNSPTQGRFTDILREKGIPVCFLGLKRTFYFHQTLIMAQLIRRERVNIVHTHCTVLGNILSRLAAKIAGVPVISHIHIDNYFRDNLFIRGYQIFLDNWTARLNKKIIAVSQSVKDSLIRQGIGQDKIEVVYNGIDVENCKPEKTRQEIYKEFHLKEDKLLVGMVGRLSSAKGQKEFILAAKRVVEVFPQIVFMIVGEDLEYQGQYKNELIRLIKELGLSNNVIFTGFQADTLSIINAFDLLVLPSLFEGLPVVVLEAMALKKPVIATPVGGVPEIIVDGSTGNLVPAKDIDRLAKGILFHLNNPSISKKMGETGFERVRQVFSLSKMLNRVIEIYEEILNGSKW